MRITDQVGAMLAMQTRPVVPSPEAQADGKNSATATTSTASVSAPPPVQSAASSDDTSTDDDEPQSAYDRILEVGFSKYTQEIEEKKLEEMRAKILAAMGLTEEMLAKMTTEQRDVIEKMIEQEIARRIEGGAVLSGDAKDEKLMPDQNTGGLNPVGGGMDLGTRANGITTTKGANLSMGLGPLLALQEIDQGDAQTAYTDGLEKVGKKGPYGL